MPFWATGMAPSTTRTYLPLLAFMAALRCSGSSRETARIQETHILIGHVLCQLVDAALYGGTES